MPKSQAGKTTEQDARALSELLPAEFTLDPGGVLAFAETLVEFAPRVALKCVFNAIRKSGSPTVKHNASMILESAFESDPQLHLLAQRSVKKRGTCPPGYRTDLRKVLGKVAGSPIPAHKAPVSGHLLQTHSIDLTDLDGSITQIPEVINRIGRIGSVRPGDLVRINLGEFTYASALALLAGWIIGHDVSNYAIDCSQQMRYYLDRIGFDRAINEREVRIEPDDDDWAVGLTRINSDLPTEKVTAKIMNILTTFVRVVELEKGALDTLIAEMIENVHRHGEIQRDGIAVAQVYPAKQRMGITLVDTGVGVPQSFRARNVFPGGTSAASDLDFLRYACEFGVTSKGEAHSGYGLWLLSSLMRYNRGTFLLASGRSTLVGYQSAGEIRFDSYPNLPWKGTIVSLVVNLYGELPLAKVYEEMPRAPWEDEWLVR